MQEPPHPTQPANHLTPRQLARAIGASESSVKRWVDDGAIPAVKTSGGHRRIPLRDAVAFVRTRGLPLAHPEALGPSFTLEGPAPFDRSSDRLCRLLEEGDRARARALLLLRYAEGESLAALFDGPLREALVRIGELWQEREDGVFVEHRATAICLEILHRLNLDLVARPDRGPVAVGGACAGDPSSLPTLMASLVVRGEGFRDVDLGPNTPCSALLRAVERSGARIVWLSANHVAERERLAKEIRALVEATAEQNVTCILGGRGMRGFTPPEGRHVYVAERLAELAALARGLRVASDEAPLARG